MNNRTISPENSTTTLLLSNGTFQGSFEKADIFKYVTVSIKSDINSSVNGLIIKQANDRTNVIFSETFTYDQSPNLQNFTIKLLHPYCKIEYTNSSTNQTSFFLNTIFNNSEHSDKGSIDTKLESTNTKLDTMQTKINSDAFGRLMVSNQEILFISKPTAQNYNNIIWDTSTTGSGSITTSLNPAHCLLSVSNLTGSAIRQSTNRSYYIPGKAMVVKLTGILGNQLTGITSQLGYYDGINGLFFKSSNNIISLNILCGGSIREYANQSNWNLDKMDGTGDSGITIDWTKVQIFVITFQWLGVGIVKFGLFVDGTTHYIHQFLHANVDTQVYMNNPNLPIRFEISNNGTGIASSFKHICSSITHESIGFPILFNKVIQRTSSLTASQNTWNSLIAIKLNDTYKYNSVVYVTGVSIISTSSGIFFWKLILNPTITGTALSWNLSPAPYSSIDCATTTTNATTLTNGFDLDGGVIASGNSTSGSPIFQLQTSMYHLGVKIDGTSDIIVLAIYSLEVSDEYYATLTYTQYD